jgi:CheY-like chemotaxis protein
VPDTPLIVLVDDDQDAREMYSEYLTFMGFRVVTAASGREAIALIQARLPSLVLMDLRMPELTGAETLKLLRTEHVCDGVPVLALTAHAMDAEVAQALDDGFDAVISKPCLPDRLVELIQPHLANARQSEQPRDRSSGT